MSSSTDSNVDDHHSNPLKCNTADTSTVKHILDEQAAQVNKDI
jgi:hypothetical protein